MHLSDNVAAIEGLFLVDNSEELSILNFRGQLL